MRYFNTTDISKYQKRIILEEYDIRKINEDSSKNNVFLSYSSKDSDKLGAVINFLEGYGVNVYVDKTDPNLPIVTSPETAQILKDNVKKCNKFVVLVSENSKDSKWIPWELGIADVEKNNDNIALFPNTNDHSPIWAKQEYLGLYDRISQGKLQGYSSEVWMVWNYRKNTATELGQWLKS